MITSPSAEGADWSEDDQHWMARALDLAQEASQVGEVPVGAVLVSAEGLLLGEGYNQPLSSHDPTAHAEIVALRAAGFEARNYRLPGSRLYVTLEPCLMCAGAIFHARVSEVIYAAAEAKTGVAESQLQLFQKSPLNHHCTVKSGLYADRSRELLQSFFRQRRASFLKPSSPTHDS